jgi:hypothetical protein
VEVFLRASEIYFDFKNFLSKSINDRKAATLSAWCGSSLVHMPIRIPAPGVRVGVAVSTIIRHCSELPLHELSPQTTTPNLESCTSSFHSLISTSRDSDAHTAVTPTPSAVRSVQERIDRGTEGLGTYNVKSRGASGFTSHALRIAQIC